MTPLGVELLRGLDARSPVVVFVLGIVVRVVIVIVR